MWKDVLREFWAAFKVAVDDIGDLRVAEVLSALDRVLGPHVFADDGSGRDPRVCPACADGRLSLKLGKYGAFIGCSNYPECRHTRPLGAESGDGGGADDGPRALGVDPATGFAVSVRKGPYGHYVQLGDGEGGGKPKRVAVPKGRAPGDIDIETALGLLALPREVGRHPETGEKIVAGIGRRGPYLKHGDAFVSLPADDDALTVGLNRAVVVLAEGRRGRGAAERVREIGPHPRDGKPVSVMKGRYGPYLRHDTINAPMPKDAAAETMTIEEAVAQLDTRGKPARGRRKPAAGAASTARKKPGGRKAATPRRGRRTDAPAGG